MTEPEPGAFLVVRVVVDAEFEEEFNRWYDEEHYPQRLAIRGFIRGHRMVTRAAEGETVYLAYYELTSADVLTSAEYLAIGGPGVTTPWTDRVAQHLTLIDRRVYENITPGTLYEAGSR